MFCGKCQKDRPDVEPRYSFGFYAGRFCKACAIAGFRDSCGLTDGKQGKVEDLDEFQAGGYDAIYGEEE